MPVTVHSRILWPEFCNLFWGCSFWIRTSRLGAFCRALHITWFFLGGAGAQIMPKQGHKQHTVRQVCFFPSSFRSNFDLKSFKFDIVQVPVCFRGTWINLDVIPQNCSKRKEDEMFEWLPDCAWKRDLCSSFLAPSSLGGEPSPVQDYTTFSTVVALLSCLKTAAANWISGQTLPIIDRLQNWSLLSGSYTGPASCLNSFINYCKQSKETFLAEDTF